MTAVLLDAPVPIFAVPALGCFAGSICDNAPAIKGRS
jgi:hypothetical protein